ncbi:MAG TPA: ABC transporter permease [Patescibacteria group bacterium]|nr:ABC transporter permease [Patescibacteria group bacterium]
MSAIYIMWLRQLKRHFRSKARLIGSLGQPLLFLLGFGFGFGSIYQRAGGGSYIQFLAPGIIAMSVLFTAIFSGIEVIWDRQFGFLKETLVVPVSRLQIMLGKTLGGATVATIQGLFVFFISLLVGFRPTNLSLLPLAFLFMFLIALVFTAVGTAIASTLTDMHAFQLIMNFLVMPLFFLSGALFPLEGLPKVMSLIVSLNPLSYGVDGIRGALIGIFNFGVMFDFMALLGSSIIFLFLGSFLFGRIEA